MRVLVSARRFRDLGAVTTELPELGPVEQAPRKLQAGEVGTGEAACASLGRLPGASPHWMRTIFATDGTPLPSRMNSR
jgi:hypothetical protein